MNSRANKRDRIKNINIREESSLEKIENSKMVWPCCAYDRRLSMKNNAPEKLKMIQNNMDGSD